MVSRCLLTVLFSCLYVFIDEQTFPNEVWSATEVAEFVLYLLVNSHSAVTSMVHCFDDCLCKLQEHFTKLFGLECGIHNYSMVGRSLKCWHGGIDTIDENE